jgi:hypothetical protein
MSTRIKKLIKRAIAAKASADKTSNLKKEANLLKFAVDHLKKAARIMTAKEKTTFNNERQDTKLS